MRTDRKNRDSAHRDLAEAIAQGRHGGGNSVLKTNGTSRINRNLFWALLVIALGLILLLRGLDRQTLGDAGWRARVVSALQFHEKHGEVCPANWKDGDEAMKPTTEGVADYLSKYAK